MASSSRQWFTAFLISTANLLIPISIIVFATGFFPYKPFLPGLAQYEPLEYGPPPPAPFDKLIFMVVDALRSDFVYSEDSAFHYTQRLIREGSAIPFTAYARSPTVTMPRIKAITTGSIPSFVDLILNFDEADTSSTLAAQDTWLAQLKAKSLGKLLMYGDDTWLKLFPNTFDREDGTSSFFVSDFTEVDTNVTRNIAGELQNSDWSLMVLHYLGLDHIGHKSGPRSLHMGPKQKEMDGIIQSLFEAVESKEHLQSTLIVLCGDHGMNDAGNHGASSPGETSPALVFLSPKLRKISAQLAAPVKATRDFEYYSTVEQSDIAPTLAALLGFPVSKNNLGAFIPEFLPLWPQARDQVHILVQNVRQILGIVTAAFGVDLFQPEASAHACGVERTDLSELACQWNKINGEASSKASIDNIDETWIAMTLNWLRAAQDLMSSMASNYDMPRLIMGQIMSTVAFVFSLCCAFWCNSDGMTSFVVLFLLTTAYGAMMFASSYVEEEHHFWYWSSTIWLALLGIRRARRTGRASSLVWPLMALGALKLTRTWNQTGQKFAGEPDVVKLYMVPAPQMLWILVSVMYTVIPFQILPNLEGLPYLATTSLTSILISSSFSFKLAFTAEDAPELVVGFARALNDIFQGHSLILRARVVFTLLFGLLCFAVYQAKAGGRRSRCTANLVHCLVTLLAMTQSRVTNIPIFLLFTILFRSLQALELSVTEISVSAILLQYTSFFAFGGSNAISSVDLSSAYNGISGFNVIAVGVLTLISNWAGPIFWTSAVNLLLVDKYRQGQKDAYRRHLTLMTFFTAGSVAFVMAACTALRTHLFIWTVFSPKFLYCMAWSLGQHLLINTAFGGSLFWLGSQG